MGKQKRTPTRRIRNLSIAGILGLTGCLTIIIALSALFIGLWIDSLIGRRGPATVLLLIASAPFSLYVMVRITLILVRKLDPPESKAVATRSSQEEEE